MTTVQAAIYTTYFKVRVDFNDEKRKEKDLNGEFLKEPEAQFCKLNIGTQFFKLNKI